MPEEPGRSSQGQLLLILVCVLLLLLVGGSIFAVRWLDHRMVAEILVYAKSAGSPAPSVDHPASVRNAIRFLRQVRSGGIDPDELAIGLSEVRLLFYRIGFRDIHVSAQQQDRFEALGLQQLRDMTGQDFGDDLDAWERWNEARARTWTPDGPPAATP